MVLNKARLRRVIGNSIVAVFSALLGYFFTTSPNEYGIFYLIGLLGLIVIGAWLVAWD